MNWKSLQFRFLVIVLLTVVLPFALVLTFSYVNTVRITTDFARTDVNRSLNRFLRMIPAVREEQISAVNKSIGEPGYRRSIRSLQSQRREYDHYLLQSLTEFLGNRWHIFESALWTNEKGHPIAKFSWSTREDGVSPFREVFVETRWFVPDDIKLAAPRPLLPWNEIRFFPPTIAKTTFVQYLEFPVYAFPFNQWGREGGIFWGSLFLALRLDYLFGEAAARAQIPLEQFPIIFDSTGTVFYHPRRENICQKLRVIDPNVWEGFKHSQKTSAKITSLQYKGWFVTYTTQEHWIVAIASHRPALLTKPRQIYLINGALILLTLLVAASMITLATNKISRSIAEIAAGAHAIAAGDLEQQLPVRTQDEIGTLARVFNSMADSLRGMIQERVEKEKVKELNELKSAFVANVSHELRQPLGHILMGVENLRKGIGGPIAEKQRHYLDKVRANTMALMHMISQLLDLSRIEAGRLSLELSIVSLDQIVAEVIEEAAHLWKGKDLAVSCLGRDGEITLEADREKVKEIIANLVDNAIKYTPRGGRVTVSSALRDDGVEIVVEDTGIGIPKEHVDHLFERFYQVKDKRVEKDQGLGLGLNIVKTLVELHGGSVHIESEVDKGTSVTVRLPVSQQNLSAE